MTKDGKNVYGMSAAASVFITFNWSLAEKILYVRFHMDKTDRQSVRNIVLKSGLGNYSINCAIYYVTLYF